MVIKEVDRNVCKVLREKLDAKLAELGKELGMVVKATGGARFSSESYTVKVEFAVVKDGVSMTKEIRSWNSLAELYGFKVSDLNRQFTMRGEVYTIVGMKPDSPKYPILGRRADGKTFKFEVDTVKRLLKEVKS